MNSLINYLYFYVTLDQCWTNLFSESHLKLEKVFLRNFFAEHQAFINDAF